MRYFREISRAAVQQIKNKNNVYKIYKAKIIPFQKLRNSTVLNEPFVYRKVVDGEVCGVPPQSLFNRSVFDAHNHRVYPPDQYNKVPIPFRIFLPKIANP